MLNRCSDQFYQKSQPTLVPAHPITNYINCYYFNKLVFLLQSNESDSFYPSNVLLAYIANALCRCTSRNLRNLAVTLWISHSCLTGDS